MRALLLIVAGVLVPSAWAQQPSAQSIKTFASSADIQAMIDHAKKIRKDDQQIVSQPILQLAPYRVALEYRPVAGAASTHETEAELFYVVDGAGTLVTGGKLVNEKRSNPTNLAGTAIEGGTPQRLAKGDFAIVPENTPHWISEVRGALVLMSFHVPRGGAAK